MAPEYLSEVSLPVNQISSRYRLRSSQSNQLVVPPVKLSTYGPRSLAVAGPTTWNNLPEYLRAPELSTDNFRRQLKTLLFAQYWTWHHIRTFCACALYKFRIYITIHLHYVYWPLASPRGGKGGQLPPPQPALDSILRYAQIRWEVWTHRGGDDYGKDWKSLMWYFLKIQLRNWR